MGMPRAQAKDEAICVRRELLGCTLVVSCYDPTEVVDDVGGFEWLG